MMTDIFPAGVQAQGNTTFLWIGAVPPSAPPKLSELTADTVLDFTCYLSAEDVEIGFDQAREDDTRACHEATSEAFGATTFSKDSISHIVDPQEIGKETGNLARGQIEANATQYCVVIPGVKPGSKLAEGMLCDVYKVEVGEEHISPLSSGKFKREVKTSWTRVQKAAAIGNATA